MRDLHTMPRSRPQQRTIQLLRPPGRTEPGVLAITNRGKSDFYTFREIPCDIGGRGFVLHRLGVDQIYHVRVGDTENCECECLGFLAHRKCKHVAGLLQLIEMGMLPPLRKRRGSA